MRFTPILTNIILCVAILASSDAYAETFEKKEKEILGLIGDFSERICPNIPMTGSSSSLELSGNAKAELNGLLKKMAALGIQGAAKYQESQYQGVLQKDLASATKDSSECKQKVSISLFGKLLVATAGPSCYVPNGNV